jgi:CRP-like cAMP-binding protein
MREPVNRCVFSEGEVIFSEGEPGARAFLIQEGTVEITKFVEGKPVVLGRIGVGGIFGEMALIDGRPRMATAKALVPTEVIVVSQEKFDERLEAADPFVRALLRLLVIDLRNVAGRRDLMADLSLAALEATKRQRSGNTS